MKKDFIIVGAGVYGSVMAEQLRNKGKSCIVIDKRPHIGGNCYTEEKEGIHIHKFGPHITNTNKKHVWDYLNQFASFNNYRHTGKVNYNDKIFSFPINMMTLHQLWGVKTPDEAIKRLEEVKIPIANPQNMEEWCLSQIGEELYSTFIKHYSTLQWGKTPDQLPASIVKRIPIRLTYNEDYYQDAPYQGIPVGGYTQLFANILGNTPIELEVDFFKIDWRKYAKSLIYTGAIDQFFNYQFGELEYRSLRWQTKVMSGDYQGCSIMNHNSPGLDFTRVIEHKHFELKNQPNTVVSWEYPVAWKETHDPYYPINDEKNNTLYRQYRSLASQTPNTTISGRLGLYKYLDIDDCIALAIKDAEKL